MSGSRVRDVVALLRPWQWYKNLLVLVGLVFSLHLLDAPSVLRAAAGFAVFCAVSSGVYALNDTLDARADREHPTKRGRPVASGRIPPAAALLIAAVLEAGGLFAAWRLGAPFLAAAATYVALQVGYALYLKHHVFVDLMVIAAGLVLRAIAGVVLLGVTLSPWLVLCTFFLALFLGLGKRQHELRTLGEDAASHRRNLQDYSPDLLQQATTIVTSVLVASYSLYTFFHQNRLMMATIPLALYGLFRYLYLVEQRGEGGEPERVFRDAPSLVNLLLWGALVVTVLYLGPRLPGVG